jgi:hypothetical protein
LVEKELNESLFAAMTSSESHLSSHLIGRAEFSTELLLPAGMSGSFKMSQVLDMVAQEAPPCNVFVGDKADLAVHVFSSGGEYLRTIELLQGTDRLAVDLSSMALMPDGRLAVLDGTSHELWLADQQGTDWERFGLSGSQVDAWVAGVELTSGPDRFFERAVVKEGAYAQSGLVRMWSFSGERLGGVGKYLVDPGSSKLTDLVNRGSLSYAGGKLWFFRHFDGVVLEFGENDQDPRSTRLPVFLPPKRPRHLIDTLLWRSYPLAIRYQLGPSKVDSRGRMIVSQLLSDGVTWALSLQGELEAPRYLTLPGRPIGLAPGCEEVWIALDEPESTGNVVGGIPYRVLTGTGEPRNSGERE